MQKPVALALGLVAVITVGVGQRARAQETPDRQQPILVGAFQVFKRTDAITNEDRSAIATFSSAMATGSSDRVAFLAWNCKPDGLRVQYSFGQLMNSVGDRVIVRYRFADTPATERELWNLATGHKSTFLPKVDVTRFTREAGSFQTVAIRVRNLESEVTDVFRLDGLTEALSLLPCYRQSGPTH